MKITKSFKGSINKFQRLTKNWTDFTTIDYNPNSTKKRNWDTSFKVAHSIIDKCKIIRTKSGQIDKIDIIPMGPIELWRNIITFNL